MPTITNATVFAAATTPTNLIAGSQYEYLPNDGMVEFGAVATVTDTALLTFISGSDILAQEAPVPLQRAANTYPQYPDDFHWADEAAAGDRLSLSVRTTGAVTVRWVLKLTWM